MDEVNKLIIILAVGLFALAALNWDKPALLRAGVVAVVYFFCLLVLPSLGLFLCSDTIPQIIWAGGFIFLACAMLSRGGPLEKILDRFLNGG